MLIAAGLAACGSGDRRQPAIRQSHRTVRTRRPGGHPGWSATRAYITGAIQTSAAINPGNSGGALANISGQVVGIPPLTAKDPEAGGPASGIGFAIPSYIVIDIADQLIATGKVTRSTRASLDIEAQTVASSDGSPPGPWCSARLAGALPRQPESAAVP